MSYEPRVLVRRVEMRPPGMLTLAAHGLASLVLVPSYAVAAAAIGTPGMRFHLEAVSAAVRLVTRGKGLGAQAGRLALYPMDSTRYFEFDWVWSRLQRLGSVKNYLDVSSPRLFPLSYVRRSNVERAWFVNPDTRDLETTRQWADALSLTSRCGFTDVAIESNQLSGQRFDAITSISVFEHIVNEGPALAKVRSLLAPGGTLLLTLPCAAAGYDQYRDYDEYNLAKPDAEGRYFFQRFPAEPFTNLRQSRSLRISKPQSSWQMRSQHLILRRPVLVLKQQLLIDQTRYVGQQTCPVVVLHANCPSSQVLAMSCSWNNLTKRDR